MKASEILKDIQTRRDMAMAGEMPVDMLQALSADAGKAVKVLLGSVEYHRLHKKGEVDKIPGLDLAVEG